MNAIYVAAICFGGAGLAFIGYWIGSVVQEASEFDISNVGGEE